MDTVIQQKVNKWLEGSFDQPIKDEMNFTGTSSSVPAVFAV